MRQALMLEVMRQVLVRELSAAAPGVAACVDLAIMAYAAPPGVVEGEHRAVIGPPQHRALLSPAAMRRTGMPKPKRTLPIGTVPPVGGVPTRPKPRKSARP